MRPVCRGTNTKPYAKYQDALPDLESAMGRYCSYCERFGIEGGLAVEHKVSKEQDKTRILDWTNFLIGCVSCNSAKGHKPVIVADYVWPDTDNTMRAIAYGARGLVGVTNAMPADIEVKARRLIDLVGLDRHPGQATRAKKPRKRDQRYRDREEMWRLAEFEKASLATEDSPGTRRRIVEHAKGKGFFGVWMSVFKDNTALDIDMRRRLILAFTGTATDCFDGNGNCVPRQGGQL